jgi:sulfotransferase family protein
MDDAAAPPGPPLFVVGCGRSGSTLLRLMLDAHPDLAVPGESHFIPDLRRRFPDPVRRDALTAALLRTTHFRHWKVAESSVWDRVRSLEAPTFANVIEAAFLANADEHDATRWGDKTPSYVGWIPLLHELWPDARFVHLIRDGRDVALSYLSLLWGPDTVWAAARKWRRDVGAGIRDGQPLGTSRYLEVRYEDLVADPKDVLVAICGFAALRFDEAMLDPDARRDHPTLAPDGGRTFHARAEEEVTAGARDWRTQMAPDAVRRFEAVAGPLLSDLGYERRFPDVPVRDRVEGAVRAGALDARAIASTARKTLGRRLAHR